MEPGAAMPRDLGAAALLDLASTCGGFSQKWGGAILQLLTGRQNLHATQAFGSQIGRILERSGAIQAADRALYQGRYLK
jgi:hypothetical protein